MYRRSKMSKSLAVFLCLLICAQLFPVSVLASAEPAGEIAVENLPAESLETEELIVEEETPIETSEETQTETPEQSPAENSEETQTPTEEETADLPEEAPEPVSEEPVSEEPVTETAEEPVLDGEGNTYTLDGAATANIELVAQNGQAYTFSGTGATWKHNVEITLASGTATVLLDNVDITGTLTLAPAQDATIILDFTGSNSITASTITAAALNKTGEGTLILRGSGSLTAVGKNKGAAIGGANGEDTQNIIFESGTVTATAGLNAAAIGGGDSGTAKNIIIRGGNITATSKSGAAIGGGNKGSADGITIEGGTVNAASSGSGAAIGSGANGAQCANISVTGGTVTAGSANGAAIGGGNNASDPAVLTNISVSGGTLTLSSDAKRPIGDGVDDTADGITLTGGIFTLTNSCTAEFLQSLVPSGLELVSLTTASSVIGKDVSVSAGKLTGGSYNFDPTAWTADGYSVSYENAMWTIGENGVFETGGRSFAELQSAVDAAADGGTVSLKDNGSVTGQLTIPAGKTVILALNGYTLTGGRSDALIKNLGTLTVTAGTITNVCDAADIGALIENAGTLTVSGTILTTDGTCALSLQPDSATSVTGGTLGTISVTAQDGTDTSLLVTGGTISEITTDSGAFNCEIQGGVFATNPTSGWIASGAASCYVKRSDGTGMYIVGKGVVRKNSRVTFGVFTFDPSEYAAEGCEVMSLDDGRWLVQAPGSPVVEAVTETDTKQYNSLAAALLLSEGNVALTMISDDEENVDFYIDEGREVSLDLAGHTLKIGQGTRYSYCFMNHGTLTIADSSGNNSGVFWTSMGIVWNYSKLTVTGGQLYSNSYTVLFADEGSDTTITGGRFISEYNGKWDGLSVQVYRNANSFTLTGGEIHALFIHTTNTSTQFNLTGYLDTCLENRTLGTDFPYQYADYGFAEGYAPVQVYLDGTEALLLGKDVTLALGKVTGGTFSFDLSLYHPELLSYGYILEYEEGAGWVVKDDPSVPVVASVGKKTCHSLAEALDIAQDGDIVTLLSDVTVTETAVFSTPIAKATLNLDGHTVSGAMADPLIKVSNGELTIIDTSVEGTGRVQNTGLVLQSDSTIVIRGGTFVSTESYALSMSYFHKAIVYGGSLVGATVSVYVDTSGTISGYQLTTYGGSIGKIVCSETEKYVALYGGVFKEDPNRFVAEGYSCVAVRKNGTGESAYLVGKNLTADANGKITGGMFTFDPQDYVDSSTKITANADGTWTVGYTAAIGSVTYPTLAAAVAALKGGETITMMADETLTGRISSARSFTLELNGKIIDGDGKYGFTLYGSEVTMQDSAAVNEKVNSVTKQTLQSTGAIQNCVAGTNNMGGAISFGADVSGTGVLTLKKLIIRDCSAGSGGAVFLSSGTLILDGAQLSNNRADYNGGAIYATYGTSVTFNSGAITGNEAKDGGGIYVFSGTFTSTGGIIENNTAERDGGGLFLWGTIDADRLIASNNTAGYQGGGLCLNVVEGSIISLDAGGNQAERGGAVYLCDATLEFSGGDLRENTATYGGAVYVDGVNGSSGINLTVLGINPIRNKATYGGGLYIRNASVDLASASYMTAMYNQAEQGGLVYLESGSLSINKSGSYNTATRGGGLVYCASGSLTIRYLTDEGTDTSADGIGDIIYLGGTMDSLSIQYSTFKSSLYLNSVTGTATIRSCTFNETVSSPETVSKTLFYPGYSLYFTRDAALTSSKALLYEGGDYICSGSGDALWVPGNTALAKAGLNRYDSLTKAFTYALDGDTIQLLTDTTLTDAMTADGKTLTLDLAGKTITSSRTDAALVVNEGASLTLRDSSAEGTGAMTSQTGGLVSNSGTFILESGSLSVKNGYVPITGQEGSVTEIRGGSLTSGGNYDSKPLVYINGLFGSENTKLTVSGGYFNGVLGCNGSLVDIRVKGGVFRRFDPSTVTGDDGVSHAVIAEGCSVATVRDGGVPFYVVGQNVETANDKVIAGVFSFDPTAWTDTDNARVIPETTGWIVHPVLGESDRTGYSVSVNVQYDISLNFYVKLPTELAESELSHYTVQATFDGVTQTYSLGDTEESAVPQSLRDQSTDWSWQSVDLFDTKDGYDRYRMTAATEYAYQMGEPVSIQVYYDNYLLRSFSYSVADYFLEEMESSDDAAFANFCRTALNYGANAQLYYSGKVVNDWTYPTYTAEDLVNRSFNPDNVLATSADDIVTPETEVAGSIASVSNLELSLVIWDETTMKLRLTVTDCDSLADFRQRFTIRSSGLKILNYAYEGDHVFSVEFDGLYVDKFSKTYTLQVKSGTETIAIRYSAISYAKTLAEAKNGENLFCAFYEYIEALEDYRNGQ